MTSRTYRLVLLGDDGRREERFLPYEEAVEAKTAALEDREHHILSGYIEPAKVPVIRGLWRGRQTGRST